MTETTARIRWEPADYGAFAGHVGAIKDRLFLIRKPADRPAWRLSSPLLGLVGVESHGQGFNSVLFEPVDDQDPAPSAPGGAGEETAS